MAKKYPYKYCVIGQLTARQKVMSTRFLRESSASIIAMDEQNAKKQKLIEKAEILVIFKPSLDCSVLEGLPIEWPVGRLLVEDVDFELGTFPPCGDSSC